MKWLLYGGRGWIGSQFCQILKENNEIIIHTQYRADNENDVENEILQVKPDRIVSMIGRTHGPGNGTIDYLEQKDKLVENIRDNLYAPIFLAIICKKYNIHFTYLGTGCIFNGYTGYDENAKPDFFGSSYSTVKGFTDRLMHLFEENVLNCRIRMPINSEHNSRNFITKITTYKKLISIPNSMTVLPELLPIMYDMAKNKITGTINLTNPGLITHNEILEMYKEIVDPNFTWENFSVSELENITLAGRSNNLLNTNKLIQLYPNVTPIKNSIRNILTAIKNRT